MGASALAPVERGLVDSRNRVLDASAGGRMAWTESLGACAEPSPQAISGLLAAWLRWLVQRLDLHGDSIGEWTFSTRASMQSATMVGKSRTTGQRRRASVAARSLGSCLQAGLDPSCAS